MSEEQQKKERTMQDVQLEYSQLCQRAGHLQYQIDAHSKDLETINSRLRDLNLEAASIQAKAAESAKESGESNAQA